MKVLANLVSVETSSPGVLKTTVLSLTHGLPMMCAWREWEGGKVEE